ncbi:Hypothetical protein ETEE_2681 [Edwardsiella anguillarum ET080813]|uniref:Uncharacterized protein n=1 Tax=Edwardsiella anguillarum ET080813 TaxID=667120 RepID=A0A076LU72_9GAMM|nr:Hypothetical protein ETEE_2681 [Edwardsiella anguillarum ET080813]
MVSYHICHVSIDIFIYKIICFGLVKILCFRSLIFREL